MGVDFVEEEVHLQADCVTNSTWTAVAIAPILDQFWEKAAKVHAPDLLIYVDRVCNRMQNLAQHHKIMSNVKTGVERIGTESEEKKNLRYWLNHGVYLRKIPIHYLEKKLNKNILTSQSREYPLSRVSWNQ